MGQSLTREKSKSKDLLSPHSIPDTSFAREIENDSISSNNPQYELRQVPCLSLTKPRKKNQKFSWVRSVSVAEDERVFAVSPFNSTVCAFSQDGTYLFDFGDVMSSPWKVCVCREAVFVTDGCAVAKFTLEGDLVGKWRKKVANYRENTSFYGLDCDRSGRIYALDADRFIYVFTYECHLITYFKMPRLVTPCDLAVSGRGDLLVTDMHKGSFVFWASEDLIPYKSPFGLKSSDMPITIFCCFDSQYNILLTDPFSNCIRIYSPTFQLLHTLNENNRTPSFIRPYGITVTLRGLILCACDSDPYFYIF